MSQGPNPHEDLAGLYRAALRQHASAPVGYRKPIAATHRHEEYNPLCGDRIELQLQVSGAQIEAAAFDGEGCAICLASASLLCALAPGRTVEALLQLGENLQKALDPNAESDSGSTGLAKDLEESRLKPLLQPLPQNKNDDEGLPEEIRALLGVRPYPSRVRCATLPWTSARRALSG